MFEKIKSRLFGDPPKRRERTEKQKVGQTGEDLACQYLERSGYRIVERNYLKKWGEIDIIAKKANKLHFVEVKSVSRATSVLPPKPLTKEIKYEKPIFGKNDEYRPEDNLHPWKLQRLGRAIQSYLLDRDIPDNMDWQFDVVTVYIDQAKGLSKVSLLEDIIL